MYIEFGASSNYFLYYFEVLGNQPTIIAGLYSFSHSLQQLLFSSLRSIFDTLFEHCLDRSRGDIAI